MITIHPEGGMNGCNKFHGNIFHPKPPNVNLMVVLMEVRTSRCDASCGDHECGYKISWESIQTVCQLVCPFYGSSNTLIKVLLANWCKKYIKILFCHKPVLLIDLRFCPQQSNTSGDIKGIKTTVLNCMAKPLMVDTFITYHVILHVV